MKKITLFLLTIAMILSFFQNNVSAIDKDEIIENELKVAIISGDGTAESPYIIDEEMAPIFSQYLAEIRSEVINSLQIEENSISTYGLYDNILDGAVRGGETKGGAWVYGSGAPSVNYNGNIWMKKVLYVSKADTKLIFSVMEDPGSIWEKIEEKIEDIANKPLDEAKETIMDIVGDLTKTTAILKCLGKINSLYNAVETLKFVSDYCKYQNYKKAAENGYGMVNVTYNTAYNGAWYAQYGEDVWTFADSIRLPKTYYGVGTYTSFS